MLVNVDNLTLDRLRNSPEAMDALAKIEGFRSLNQDIQTIINRTEAVKKTKTEAEKEGRDLTPTEKKRWTLRKKNANPYASKFRKN